MITTRPSVHVLPKIWGLREFCTPFDKVSAETTLTFKLPKRHLSRFAKLIPESNGDASSVATVFYAYNAHA